MATSGVVISKVQGVAVASIRVPSILDGAIIDEIGETLYDLVDNQDCKKLIVDFRAVGFLASQMIGVLINLDNKAREIKGRVVLCGIRQKLMKVFKIMRLEKRLTFAAEESEALSILEAK